MSNEQETQEEIRRILRLLETTTSVIEKSFSSASSWSTVDLKGGEERCARQFNNALNCLTELGAVPADLFEPLEIDTDFGDISLACQQVTVYIREGCAADFDFAHMKKTINDELKDVGEAVRQSMPDFLKDLWGERAQEKSDDSAAETVEVTSDEDAESMASVEQRIARLEGQMETVVEILQEIRAQQLK